MANPALKLAPFLAAMTWVLPAGAPEPARLDAWRVLGPGGGGAQFHPTISPHDQDRVLVGCDMTGSYLSKDGGQTWRMFNLRGVPSFFVFDPVDAAVIYAKTIGLWRSEDGGDTWNLVHPDPSAVTGIEMPDDHAEERLITVAPEEAIVALAVDPADSGTLYAAFAGGGAFTLRISADRGSTWAPAGELRDGASGIYVDPRSPQDDRTLYVIGNTSVAVREGGTWRQGAAAPEAGPFTSVSAGFLEEGGKLSVYVVSSGGLFLSDDGGASWRPTGPAARIQAVATSLNHPRVAYASFSGLREGGQTLFGVARSTDTGRTWELVWRESNRKAENVDDGWISERFGPGWGENPLDLGVSPVNPEVCYATDYGRTLRSLDGGKTWRAAYTRKMDDGSYSTSGLDVTTGYGVHFDPFNPGRVFVSYTDIGLFRSENSGASWASATSQGVPRNWVNTTYWVEFDLDVAGRMWAVMSGTHDLPRPKMWRRTSPASYVGGVCRSDDGGRTWRALAGGLPPTAATHILVDRRGQADARVLYLAGFGKGVFKSTDGGETWALKNNGLPPGEPFAWRLAQDGEGVLYLVIARRSENSSFGGENDGALYRSTDGAESWRKLPLPAGANGPNGLAIDPADPRRLYLAAWGRLAPQRAVGGGIFVSTDAGATWRAVLSRDQHIYDVTVDPRTPSTLYACGFESSAWRSTDRGESWERIRGYNFKWGHRVIPDPANPEMIYVTTFGGGVWHGPAAGDPTAVEDIVTPEVAYSAIR